MTGTDGRLLHIFEKTESNVFWIDDEYRYVAFSPAHSKTMRARFGAEVSLGANILDYVEDPSQRELVQDLLDQALAGRTIVEVGAAGEGTPDERHLEATYTPVPGPDGAIVGVFVSGRDVTAADKTETDLWRRETQLAQSQKVARMGHWFRETDESGIHLSGQALEMIDRLPVSGEPSTLDDVRQLLRRIVHPDDRMKAEILIQEKAPVTPVDFEFRVVTDAGEVTHLSGRVEAVTGQDGRTGILGVFQDDTEQWRTQEELSFSEARLRRAEDLAGIGHWSVDPATGETRWSRGFFEILGLDPDVVAPNASLFLEIVHPDDREAALEYVARVNAATERQEITHRVVRPDGEVRLIVMHSETQRDETGEAVLHFGAALDITESERAQRELEENSALADREVDRLNRQLSERVRELATANEELNDLLYSLAHDLRSPLRAIDGFSLAFAEDHVDATDAAGAEQIGRVRAAARRLGMLFDAALDLASVGRTEISPRDVDLSALAESVAAALQAGEPERETEIAIAGGLTDVTDPGLAHLVFLQLLDNAWAATASCSPGRIEVDTAVIGGEHRYFVRDDGVGFDQSYAGKVFAPYQQLRPAEQGEGTGVGLAKVRRAVDRLGGRCWAEAEPDRGATFWFTLGPAADETGGAEPAG